MTSDELKKRVFNIVDAVAGGTEVTIQNGHPRNPKLTYGATDAILALIDQAQGVPVEPSEVFPRQQKPNAGWTLDYRWLQLVQEQVASVASESDLELIDD